MIVFGCFAGVFAENTDPFAGVQGIALTDDEMAEVEGEGLVGAGIKATEYGIKGFTYGVVHGTIHYYKNCANTSEQRTKASVEFFTIVAGCTVGSAIVGGVVGYFTTPY